MIFTASMKAYAEQVLKEIDPKYLLRYKFYREACFEIDGNYIKDLRLLGRNLKHVVIIDNSAQAFSFQPDNGILISSWFDDPNDKELDKLIPYLNQLRQSEDIRDFLRTYKL